MGLVLSVSFTLHHVTSPIEQDMFDRSERQFLREQRSANVKKVLAESSDLSDNFNGLSNGVSSMNITKRTQKQITSY